MQIVIPMSGFGERFRIAGHTVPKPIIEVEGKPIIQHVVEMFPGETDFTFICNQDHLNESSYRMREILEDICPSGNIVGIAPHKLGPVHAVLQIIDQLNPDKQTVVNYCDFTCYWDWKHFNKFVSGNNCDGAIPSYRGFHPHTLWSNYYAYVKENNYLANDIQEKQPFTDTPREEFASSGTYYFKSADLMHKYFERCISEELMVSTEYYVSMVYKPMMDDGLKVYAYELQHFMQWGTPDDLQEYEYWSDLFKSILQEGTQPYHPGAILLPMVGQGSRFKNKGYIIQKPLIPVSGKPMAQQALLDLPQSEKQRFILRADLDGLDELKKTLGSACQAPEFSILDHMTDGQASSCEEGSEGLDSDLPVTIAACDNGMTYNSSSFEKLFMSPDIDVIVWGARNYPGAKRAPQMYGWIDVDSKSSKIYKISVKKPLSNPAEDPIVVGAFTFKRLADFLECVKNMKERKAMINGEYYVDTAINDAISLGLNCHMFEIEHYICWGTPNDLRTFEYWQSCFHKWHSHPYRLDNDSNICAKETKKLDRLYTEFIPNGQ